MPVGYCRDDARRRIRYTAVDPVTVEEAVATLKRQLAEGVWHYGVVVDLRRGVLSATDANRLVVPVRELVAQHGPHGPMALVAREASSISRSQAYAMRTDEARLTVEVFWDLDQAEAWLDEKLSGEDPTIDVKLSKDGLTKRFVIFEAGASGWLTADPDHGRPIMELRTRDSALARRAAYEAEMSLLIQEGWTRQA